MAVFKCKMCGGDLDIIENSTVCVCQYCETKQTVPLMDSDKKSTLFARANRLRFNCEFDKAYSIYEAIIADFPEEAEAYWGLVLCKYGVEYVDDPKTAKKIPTCHRSSFNSVMDDEDFEKACEYALLEARDIYRSEAKQIEELRRDIISISSKEDPYDIFICYKETDKNGDRTIDSVIAQDVYELLTRKGYRVFFSRISLEDKLGREYEPYIFSALHSAKIMLVFGTDYEHFNAVWVKNEWSRFLRLMEDDDEKALIPCFRDIDAYDMPKEFAHLQAQDMGKVGAMQDLLRGIEKILEDGDEDDFEFKVSDLNAVLFPLLNRAKSYLRKEDYSKADEYFNKVLDFAPENEDALLGKLLVEFNVKTVEELAENTVIFIFSDNYKNLIEVCDNKLKQKLDMTIKKVKENLEIAIDALAKTGQATIISEICNKILLVDKENKKAILYKLLSAFYVTSIDSLSKSITPFADSREYELALKHCDDDVLRELERASEQIRLNVLANIKEALDRCYYSGAQKLIYRYYSCYPSNDEIILYKFLAIIKMRSLKEAEEALCEIYNTPEYSGAMEKASASLQKELQDTSERIKAKIAANRKKQQIKSLIVAAVIIGIFMLIFATISIVNNRPMSIYSYTDYNGGVAITGINKPEKAIKNGHLEIPQKICGKPVYCVSDIDYNNFSSVTLPNTVTVIGENAFNKCSQLKNVNIPRSVKIIQANAFSECTALEEIVIPSSVTKIQESAFSGCALLKEIFIPQSVTIIEKHAFNDCQNLTIYCQAKEKPSNWAFSWNTDSRPTFWDVTKYGVTENGLSWYKHYDNTIIIRKYIGTQENVVIPSLIDDCQVVRIDDNAFFKNNKVTYIEIPDTVLTIGAQAFYECKSLKTIKLPHNLKYIETNLFYYCSALETVEIPWGVVEIKRDAFSGCTSLSTVNIPNTVTSIGNSAFEYCYALSSIEVPDSVTIIDDGAFASCISLSYFKIPSNLEIIGHSAFANCTSLKSIEIPNGVTTIRESAFYSCSSLTSITIPSSVKSIGGGAFKSCIRLTSIVIPISITFIGGYAFEYCSELTIYCEASSQPSAWNSKWDYNCPVVWGYKKQ